MVSAVKDIRNVEKGPVEARTMCDISAPQPFIKIKYRPCFYCRKDTGYFLLLAKVGPLQSVNAHRGMHIIRVSNIECIDEWEIELELAKQEVTPIELEDFHDQWGEEFSLCQMRDWECGMLDADQINRSRVLFAELSRRLGVLGL